MLSTRRSATPRRVHQLWDAIDQCSTQGSVNVEQIMTIVTSMPRDELNRELEAAIRDKLIVVDVIKNENHAVTKLYKLPEQEMTKPDHHDWYCFICHLGAGGQIVGCKDCPRIFHLDCLPDDRKPDGDLFICPPCHIMATKPSAELLNLKPKKLNKLLKYSCRRLKDLGIPEVNRADGESWAVASNREAKDKWRYDLLVYFNIDLYKMLKKAVDRDYQSLEEFQVDCETLIHGMRVYFGVEQLEGKSIAVSLYTEVMDIIEEIKSCHECFRRSCEKEEVGPLWFCIPCKIPHQVVWAKLATYPFWPAKVMKIDGSKYVVVIFFGGSHQWSTIDAKNILPIDTPLSSLKIRKTRTWNKAYEELQKFLEIAKNPEKFLPTAKADKNVTSAEGSSAKSKGTPGKRAASSRIEEKGTKKSKNEVAAQKSQEERAEPNVDMNSHGYKLRSKDPPSLDDAGDDDDDANTNSIPEQTQQPPIYFNTNLMKIKMEVDYVPIKTEPDQEIGGDNNDNGNGNGQLSSPSFSVESRDNNTNSSQDKNLPPAPETVDPKLAQLTTPKAISSGTDGASPMILNSKIPSAKTTTTTPVTTITKLTEVIAQIFQTPQGLKVVYKGPTQDMTPQVLQQIQAQIAAMSGLSNGATLKFHIQSSQTTPNSPTTTITHSGQKLPLPNAPTNATPKTRQQNGQLLHKTSDGKIQSGGQRRAAPINPNMKKVPPSNTTSGNSSSSSSATNLTSQSKKSTESLDSGKTMPQQKLEIRMTEIADKNKTPAAALNDITEITKRNADLNTKAKPEERINSISQEQTEIQKTLQNQIDQLNLVNGQQQTNIHALNSIITQQWTENNKLKSQVAEQQKQIEELNKKLKSRDENQQSTENIQSVL